MVLVCAHNPQKGLHVGHLFQPIVGHDFSQSQGAKCPQPKPLTIKELVDRTNATHVFMMDGFFLGVFEGWKN